MKARGGEQVEIAGMIVMQMRDDHIPDAPAIDAERGEAVADRATQATAASGAAFRRKARVDDDAARALPQRPDVIIHRHGMIVQIAAAQKIAASKPLLMHRVAQRVDLPFGHPRPRHFVGATPSAFNTSCAALKASRPAGMPQ